MKTKVSNTTKEISKLIEKISNKESLFAIYVNDKTGELSVLCTDSDNDNRIICAISAILETSLTDKGDEGMDRVTNIILEALKLVQTSKSIAGLKLATEMLKGVVEKASLVDDNNEEDCDGCELVKTCNLNAAIKYRKAHGIPRPKKGKGHNVDVN